MARKRKQLASSSSAEAPKQSQRKRQQQSEPSQSQPPQEQEQDLEQVEEEVTPTTPTVEQDQQPGDQIQQPEEDNSMNPQGAEAEAEEDAEEDEAEGDDEEAEAEEEEAEAEEELEENEEDEEEEEEEGNQTANGVDPPPKSQSVSEVAAACHDGASNDDGGGAGGDDNDEPVQKLLEPFTKEQLFNLLLQAAETHADVADRVRRVADEDPAHRKIFVHGLGWDTTAETLISVFSQYGPIEDCKAVSDKISGKSKGYGFILFKSRKGARLALQQPQKKIGNRMTACQLASMGPVPASAGSAASQAAAAALVPSSHPVSEYTLRKIYVSNVSSELDPQKLLAFFAKFGEIEEGPLGLDKYTGKPKGFCLFVYRSHESAKKALEEPHKNFEGHILHCQKAIDGPKPGKPHSQHLHHSNPQSAPFQRSKNLNFTSPAATGPPTHLMAPSAPGIGLNQQAQALNPAAVGQALSALLATQGAAGLGFTNLLSTLGSAGGSQGIPGYGTQGLQGGYGNQGVGTSVSPGVMGGYGNQGGYPNQQLGQGGSGRPQHSQHGVGHIGGVPPYMNH